MQRLCPFIGNQSRQMRVPAPHPNQEGGDLPLSFASAVVAYHLLAQSIRHLTSLCPMVWHVVEDLHPSVLLFHGRGPFRDMSGRLLWLQLLLEG